MNTSELSIFMYNITLLKHKVNDNFTKPNRHVFNVILKIYASEQN
jgi:hypothetical protein